MTRENKYIVEISFDNRQQEQTIFFGQVPYIGSASFKDEILITTRKTTIEASRSNAIEFDSIFYNHSSSLYNQIIKTLLFYYATLKRFIPIKLIKISRTRNGNVQEAKIYSKSDFNQVLNKSFKLGFTIDSDNLKILFQDSTKGISTFNAVSYILQANSAVNEADKFEKLWKAFNRLYTQISGTIEDFESLRNLRSFILANPAITRLSRKIIKPLTTEKLRNSIRWRAMILNDFATEAKTESFKSFVLRYSDKRFMQIINDTHYGYREEYLTKRGFLKEVDDHIQSSIAYNKTDDNEIVTFLTGKYMYFVRNKSFHGEKIDSSFRLAVNKEDVELKFLNNVLEAYLFDLINANNLY